MLGYTTRKGGESDVMIAHAGARACGVAFCRGERLRPRAMVDRVDGRVVDAWVCGADEGRGPAAKCPGERRTRGEPGVPEWSNPPRGKARHPARNA